MQMQEASRRLYLFAQYRRRVQFGYLDFIFLGCVQLRRYRVYPETRKWLYLR